MKDISEEFVRDSAILTTGSWVRLTWGVYYVAIESRGADPTIRQFEGIVSGLVRELTAKINKEFHRLQKAAEYELDGGHDRERTTDSSTTL